MTVSSFLIGCWLAPVARSEPVVLDDATSAIRFQLDPDNGRLSVILKSTGAVWSETESTEAALKLSNVSKIGPLRATAEAGSLRLSFELKPSTSDVAITLGGDLNQELGRGGIVYPQALFPADGSGYAILPFFGGYAVPTSETKWTVPWSHARMEWFGGVDRNFESGWMFIAEPAADMQLTATVGDVAGKPRLGGAFRWIGSNASPSAQPNRLSYERRAVLHFFAKGGYVAQAKHFRSYAVGQGWFKSLREKGALNPQVDKLVGAPVIYLWGDGRSMKMLDAMKEAGIDRALIQLSINHVDQNGAFPNTEFADGDGWSKAVRSHGYVPGIYDIYAAARTGGGERGGRGGPASGRAADAPPRPVPAPAQGGQRYSGFTYLWPANASEWTYVGADGGTGQRATISHQMSAKFALETRLPAHIRQFGLDAFFFDTVCALDPNEDYDRQHGHPATRAQDIANRIRLLETTTLHFKKLTGTEQIKSWAVPNVHWAEGMFKLGSSSARGQVGAWNDNTYPQVMVDVQDLGENRGTVLDTGFQVPLWELVYHDALISVQHWHMVHNKLVDCWDFADEFALIRGQSPILNLVYAGDRGRVGREIQGVADADGKVWDTRWTNPNVVGHVLKTFNSVSRWQGRVAYLEMTDHRLLVDDFSVQASEFSADGGKSGRGIVVNFGKFDGDHAMTGPAWTGDVRGKQLTVPVNGFAEYSW